MQKRGFTLLEVIVAVTIGVALIGIGIPSFTNLVRRQEFQSEAGRLAGCLQSAQEYALSARQLSNGQSVRWSAADISYNASTQVITCKKMLFSTPRPTNSLWTDFLTGSLAEDELAGTETINSIYATGFTYGTATTGLLASEKIRVYFGQTERGAVVRLIAGNYGMPSKYSQYGTAMSISLTSSVDDQQTAKIIIGSTGTPIQLTSE